MLSDALLVSLKSVSFFIILLNVIMPSVVMLRIVNKPTNLKKSNVTKKSFSRSLMNTWNFVK